MVNVLHTIVSEFVETEATSAPVEPQPEPPACGACARTVADNTEYLSGSTLTDAERHFLARYPCIDRLQLAELREAFLMMAVGNAPSLTPRMAAATAASARLDAADIATCLRAVGQNPSQADIVRIVSVMTSQQKQQQQQQHREKDGGGGGGGGFATAAASNTRAATTQQLPSAANRPPTAASDTIRRQSISAHPSGLQTPTNEVGVLEMTESLQ